MSFNHVRRTTNKLTNILANQGVISTKSKVVLKWPELSLSRLKTQCHDQADEDIMVFRNKDTEAGSS